MNDDWVETSFLCRLIQEILPLLEDSASIDRVLCTVENLELNIQSLEARVEIIQQEIDILIAEQ